MSAAALAAPARAAAKAASGASVARRNRDGYLFLSPWLIGFFCLTGGPILASLYFSFTDFSLFNEPAWVGLENYKRLIFDDPRYRTALGVTLAYVVTSVPLKLAFALAVALLLNRNISGVGLYRAIYYLPSLLGGSVAVAVMWRKIFAYDGVVNDMLLWFGIDGPSWISNPDYALSTIVALAVWQFGSPAVIFLAGLKQIPPELYDAADIDGAGRFATFRTVTLPLLTPIIFFNLVMQMISAFQAFTPSFIISNGTGGPDDSTLFYTLYLYEEGFSHFRMGYASAMAWALVGIIATATAFTFISSRYWVHYGDR
ncbi:sugar ABC transporter permease [Terrarubrum flagellatum]|uniref:carbohydrate ABC transporter permease n=1 Tax=Terrirubrum flagellatum TaxID=2895980 RepID=UPI003144EF21